MTASTDQSGVRIKLYVTEWCGFCRRAEALLRQKGLEYERLDVTGDRDTRQWLAQVTGQRTVPQVFIDDEPIGGCQELYALDATGRLDELLAR